LAKLKIYIDENVDIRVAEGLRKRGIKVLSAEVLLIIDRKFLF